MSLTPKFTFGDSVVVTDSGLVGSVCALTDRGDGVFYTVEFPDGSDCLLAEESLSPLSEREA